MRHAASSPRERIFLDAPARFRRVEVRRAGRCKREADATLQCGVDEPERVPGIDCLDGRIVDDEVMLCVAGRVVDAERRASELEGRAILEGADALLRNGVDATVKLREARLAVDLRRARDEAARVDEVTRCARVREQRGVRAPGQQGAGSSRVVEMRVGDDDPAHLFRAQTSGLQCAEQPRNGMRRMRLDERALVGGNAKIGRRELRYDVAVDRVPRVMGHAAESSRGRQPR